ncbi:MAG: hypothetical protein LJE84_06265 [Gammaproteobacteria bacterium]|jgi:hypothetical protein|nr:hypothetical protein [Gammaproteobacteria bacterium]
MRLARSIFLALALALVLTTSQVAAGPFDGEVLATHGAWDVMRGPGWNFQQPECWIYAEGAIPPGYTGEKPFGFFIITPIDHERRRDRMIAHVRTPLKGRDPGKDEQGLATAFQYLVGLRMDDGGSSQILATRLTGHVLELEPDTWGLRKGSKMELGFGAMAPGTSLRASLTGFVAAYDRAFECNRKLQLAPDRIHARYPGK